VLMLYLAGCALGVLAMFITQADVIQSYVIGAGVLIAGIVGLARLERRELLPALTNSLKEVPVDSATS